MIIPEKAALYIPRFYYPSMPHLNISTVLLYGMRWRKSKRQKTLNLHKPFFNLKAFHVTVEKRGTDEACFCEATIKVEVDGEEEHTVGEGTGPVEALDRALRKALARFYPTIMSVRLTDFRVRILDPGDATAAVTRVVIESTDGVKSWGTVGVSPNIIEASWQALVDSVEYKLYAEETAKG